MAYSCKISYVAPLIGAVASAISLSLKVLHLQLFGTKRENYWPDQILRKCRKNDRKIWFLIGALKNYHEDREDFISC